MRARRPTAILTGVDSNLDVVRGIYAAWEQGDYSSVDWAYPDFEYVYADTPDGAGWKGLADVAAGARDWLAAWYEFSCVAEEYRELDGERVLVLDYSSGRGRASDLEVGATLGKGAHVFYFRDGKVTRVEQYLSRDRELADLLGSVES
jgi:ketosteroid isomerase-like protein